MQQISSDEIEMREVTMETMRCRVKRLRAMAMHGEHNDDNWHNLAKRALCCALPPVA